MRSDTKIDLQASEFSGKTFWFLTDAGIECAREEILESSSEVVIVALGYKVIHWAKLSRISVFVLADFFSAPELQELSINAALAARTVVDAASQKRHWKTHDGSAIGLPGIDLYLLKSWSFTAAQIGRLIKSLGGCGIKWEIAVAKNDWDPRQHSHDDLLGLMPRYLKAQINNGRLEGPRTTFDANTPFTFDGMSDRLSMKQRLVSVRHRYQRFMSPILTQEQLQYDAVVVAVESDLSRKRQDFVSLLEAGMNIVFVPFSSRSAGRARKTKRFGENIGLPTAIAPTGFPRAARWHSFRLRTRLRRRLSPHVAKDQQFSPLEGLGSVSDELAARWGVQLAEFNAWKRFWRATATSCAIVVRSTPPSALPALAAVEVGISICTLPHGLVETGWPVLPQKKSHDVAHLTGFALSDDERERGFVESIEGVIQHEYPRTRGQKKIIDTKSYKKSVAFLVDHNNVLLNGIMGAQIQAQNICAAARCFPEYLFIIKDHPSGPLFQYAFEEIVPENVTLSVPDEDLHALLGCVDAVVLVNYWGSAGVHAFLCDKPLLRFQEPESLSGVYPIEAPKGMMGISSHISVATSISELNSFLNEIAEGRQTGDLSVRPRHLVSSSGRQLSELIELAKEKKSWSANRPFSPHRAASANDDTASYIVGGNVT